MSLFGLAILFLTAFTITQTTYLRYNEYTTTFWEAQRECSLRGGKLWEPKTEEELKLGLGIYQTNQQFRIGKLAFWIGAWNFPDGRFNWHWIHSGRNFSNIEDPYYNFDKFWCPGEPANYHKDEHCVFVAYRGEGVFCLEDLSCQNNVCLGCTVPQPKIGYICEVP